MIFFLCTPSVEEKAISPPFSEIFEIKDSEKIHNKNALHCAGHFSLTM